MTKASESKKKPKKPPLKFRIKRYILVRYKTRIFKLRNYFKYKFKKKFNAVKISILTGVVFTLLVGIFNGKYLKAALPEGDGVGLFFTLGATVIGAIAIVFSLSTIILTNTLDKVPKSLYIRFVTDKLLDLIFVLISFGAIALFALGVSYHAEDGTYRTWLFRPAIIIMVWVVILIYLFYKRVQHILNPQYIQLALSKNIKDEIDEIHYLVEKQTDIITTGLIPENDAQIVALRASYYRQLNKRVDGIKYDISQLVILHNRAYANGDTTQAGDYLVSIFGAIIAYLTSRKDSTFAEMSDVLPVPQSDSSHFIESICEVIAPMWDKYLDNNDLENMRNYLRWFKGIVAISLQLKHANSTGDNPAYDTAYFRFNSLVDKAIKAKNVDAMFEAANMLWQIAKDTLEHRHYITPIDSILKDLRKLFIASVAYKEDAVVNEVVKAMQKVYEFEAAKPNKQNDDALTEKAPEIIGYISSGVGGGLLVDTRVGEFAESLMRLALADVPKTPKDTDLKKVVRQAGFYVAAASAAYASNNGKSIVGQSFNRSFVVMFEALLDLRPKANERLKPEFDNLIRQMIATLPAYGKKSKQEGDNRWMEDFVDTQTKMGIYAVKEGDLISADKIFQNISSMALKNILDPQKTRDLYAGLRELTHAGYIAAAIHKLHPKEFEPYKQAMLDAEEKFIITHFKESGIEENTHYTPSPFAIRTAYDELIRGGSNGIPNILEYADFTLLSVIGSDDVEQFVLAIWPQKSSPTEWLATKEIQKAVADERKNEKDDTNKM